MTPRRLTTVAPAPRRAPSQITLERAAQAHPNNPEHQRRWLAAIKTLRERTRCGWIADKQQPRLTNKEISR